MPRSKSGLEQLLSAVARIAEIHTTSNDASQQKTLSPHELTFLRFCDCDGGASVSEAQAFLGVTAQTVSRIVRRLLDKELIDCKSDQNDRRKHVLFVTAKWREKQLDAFLEL